MTQRLFLKTFGKGQPLVLLHGWGCDSGVWYNNLPALTEQYRVILVDLPGFGQSAWMSFDDFTQELLQSCPEPFTVLGWSLGGMYAMRLAIEHPESITQLIGVSTSPKILEETNWPGMDNQVWNNFCKQFHKNPQATCEVFFKMHLQKKGLKPAPLNPETFQKGLDILATWDLREDLHRVKQGRFLFGGRDEIIAPKTYDTMKTHYPQFEMVLYPEVGHSVFLSHPHLFLKVLSA